jgi:GNAT superfamily N-acetyltransferase
MPNLKEILKEFVATANAGEYKTEGELLSAFPELSGYNSNTLKEFVSTANAGQYANEDELLAAFPEFGQPVKKKEESVPLWLQKQEQQQPKPKQEQTPPFLESKPSGISLGSQRVPETAPMFEAPPMRTPEEAQAIVEAPEYREAKYFEGTFGELLSNMDNPAISPNTAWIGMGDFVDDFGRAIGQGSKTGDIVAPTSKIFLNGAKTSDEDIEKFRQASELADKLGPSDEMFRFSKEYQESGKTTSGFLKALAMNPGAIPEIMVSSYSSMVNSTSLAAGGAVVGTGATTGAAAGAAAGGVGAIPGAVAGAIASIPYAMAAMGATLETNLSLAESIKDKLAQDGLEWNDENIKSVISDEKFLKDARIKAATRGVTIGAIDALTGRVAGKVGAKILKAPKGGAVKSAVAAGSIEAAGGSTGEATARALTGQEMDIAEIGLEGIAELPGTIVSVGSEVLKKPLYKVNGEIRPEADVKEIVETADGDQLAKINIEITNDTKGYNEQIQEKVVSAQVKNEVKEVNPDLDEETTNEITRLEMELKKVEGKKTQSAKDKAASIRSQIKTLQENAVQKPSTEEGVLRPEESQVGLQEVGEGDAKEQAPAQEVVKEEVVSPAIAEIERKRKEELSKDENVELLYPLTLEENPTREQKEQIAKNEQDKKDRQQRRDEINLRYDLELAALEQPKEVVTPDEDLQAAVDSIEFPEDTEVATEYDSSSSNPNHEKNMDVLGKVLSVNSISPGAEPMITETPDSVTIEYMDATKDNTPETTITLKRKKNGGWTTVGAKVEQAVSPATPVAASIGEVSIESVFDEDGEMDADAEDAVRGIAKERDLGVTRDRELATVARDENGNVIGGAYTAYDNETGEYTFDVVVSKEAEGSGVGSKLLDSVIEIPYEISDMNPKAKVKVDVVNPQMQAMLEKRGFEVTAKTGIDRVTMEKAKPKKKVSSKTPKAKSVPIPVAIPKPAPAPAPKPVAVVSQPTPRVQGPEALQEEYKAKMLAVTLNEDKSRTAKQIEERKKELIAEYQKLKAEMTAPRPKAEPEVKAAPKVEAKAAPKKAAPAPKVEAKAEPVISKKDQEAIKQLESEIGYEERQIDDAIEEIGNTKYNLKEALAEIKKKRDALKGQKMSAEERAEAKEDLQAEIENAKEEHDTYLEQYNDQLSEAKKEKKKAETKLAKLQAKQVETKAEPTSVVEEDEPSYDDIKDLDPTDETALEKILRKLDSGDASLKQFGRGNLSSGIAIPLARAIIKALKVLVKTGITLQEAIKRVAADNNIEAKDVVNMIKELDKYQSPIVKLKDQIKSEARAALNAKKDINQKRKDLSNTIKEMETTGKISAAKAKAILNKIGKVNLDNPAAVDTFLDYVENVFENAEYEVEIAGINAKLGKARNNVNRKIGTAKNLTSVLNKLFNIKPSLIPSELLDAYKNLVDMFGDSAAVLDLAEITEVTKQAQDILNQIDDQLSTVPALASKLFNYDKAVLDEDGALDYSATIEKMFADEAIDEAEYKLMKKYKSLILPRAVKIPKTKQELADEKKVLVKQVKEVAAETTISPLASDDEKKMASNIIKLAKTNAVEALDNRQLENLLKIFDNFSNGYFPAYANGLSNDLVAGENATFLSKAISKAKMPSLASVKLKLRNKRQALFAKVRSTPLFNIDEIFGDFKTKDIFNSIFNALAQNQQRYALEIEKISQRLEDALNKIAKGYGNNENKIVESKMRMAIYRIQREFESNPGDPSVNPAIEYINKTIEAIREGDTNYSEEDADMLEQIAKDYSDGKGGIDAKELDKSFNTAEKEALNLFNEINKEIEGKAIFTGDVIRGDKVRLLNNYNHINVLPAKGKESDPIADVMSKFNPKNVVSTKAKSLIERSSGAKPINFDIFSTVQRGAKFVLMDYYLTNPIRIARKTVNTTAQMMQENGTLNEGTKTILNVVKDAMELSLKSSLDQSAFKDTFGEKVVQEMAKTGYRSMLGGVPRATTEFTSNMAYIAMVAPTEWTAGVKMMKNIDGSKAVSIMKAVGSKAIIRTYGSDPLKGRLVDPSVLSKRVGIGASKLKGETLNVIATIHNNTTKKVKNSVEFVADTLISTPDKIMMRPLWFGSFEKAFEDFSGKKPDLDKIADNDADYMIKNKESLEAAGRVADEKVVMAGDVDNPYMNSLRTYIPSDASGLAKTFKVFDNFMLKFQIRDYLNARRGIHAMMGNGNISKEQGAKLMAAVVTRMTVYTVMGKMAAEFMYGLFLDDEEEDDDKTFAQKLGQGLSSTFTSLLFGRDYGNSIRSVVNYGVEKVNEKYLDFLRDGEYDPYEDAIQYTFIPPEKKGKSLEAFDVISNIAGPYSPAVKSLNFVTKKLTEEPKKEAAAIERQEKERNIRVPLEILGNLGYVPMYKDIRAIVNKSIYSELDKELDQQGQKGEEFKPMGMNKTDLERYYPEIYEQYYGAGSEAEAKRKLEYEKNLLERKMKDDYYNYVPKQRPKKGFGGKEFGSESSKKGGGFGSKGFGK